MSPTDTAATLVRIADAQGDDPLIGTLLADRYRIDEKLGEGGMGAVYRAEHVLMQKTVAIKVLHKEMTAMTEVVKRFEREAIAAGRIAHPNVTAASDFGKLPDGAFFLVLEYVPGRSLSSVVRQEGALPAVRALAIARQIASALAAAHAAAIVHRDLKPDNILLVQKGSTNDFVKVLDFGIAKVEKSGATQLTALGAVFGTPQYMSPEQASGKKVDGRADLYSLGLILHEMLAGRPAFNSEDLVVLLTKQLSEDPPALLGNVPEPVQALVRKLTRKKPEDRIQTADALVAEIDAVLVRLGKGGAAESARGPRSAAAVSAPTRNVSAVLDEVKAAAAAPNLAAATKQLTQVQIDFRGKPFPLWKIVAVLVIGFAAVAGWMFGGAEPDLPPGRDRSNGPAD